MSKYYGKAHFGSNAPNKPFSYPGPANPLEGLTTNEVTTPFGVGFIGRTAINVGKQVKEAMQFPSARKKTIEAQRTAIRVARVLNNYKQK